MFRRSLCNRNLHTSVVRMGGKYPPIITATPPIINNNIGDTVQHRLSVKPLNSRKTLLIDQYKDVWTQNKMILLCHYNNLLKQEDHQLRLQLGQQNITFMHLRNNIFKVYLRNMQRDDPVAPYDKALSSEKLILNHPINKLIKGPTALIAYPEVDSSIMNQIFTMIKQSRGKLIPLGAVIDGQILNLDWIAKFNEINGDQQQMYQMLRASLQSNSGGSLVDNLQLLSNRLVGSLSQHKESFSKDTL
ncbi:large ribosomal subunit protein uL10m [Monosporozyma servazzii]